MTCKTRLLSSSDKVCQKYTRCACVCVFVFVVPLSSHSQLSHLKWKKGHTHTHTTVRRPKRQTKKRWKRSQESMSVGDVYTMHTLSAYVSVYIRLSVCLCVCVCLSCNGLAGSGWYLVLRTLSLLFSKRKLILKGDFALSCQANCGPSSALFSLTSHTHTHTHVHWQTESFALWLTDYMAPAWWQLYSTYNVSIGKCRTWLLSPDRLIKYEWVCSAVAPCTASWGGEAGR